MTIAGGNHYLPARHGRRGLIKHQWGLISTRPAKAHGVGSKQRLLGTSRHHSRLVSRKGHGHQTRLSDWLNLDPQCGKVVHIDQCHGGNTIFLCRFNQCLTTFFESQWRVATLAVNLDHCRRNALDTGFGTAVDLAAAQRGNIAWHAEQSMRGAAVALCSANGAR